MTVVFPRLGLGTAKWGRNTGVKYPCGDGFPLPSDACIDALIGSALDLGVTLLDTAPAYGSAEVRLGDHLGRHRGQFVLCTKAGEEHDGTASRFDFSAEAITNSVHRSLRRLKTGWLDVVLLHCGHDDVSDLCDTPALEALRRLQESGDVLAVGASIRTREAGIAAAQSCDVIMLPLSPGNRCHDVLTAAAAAGTRVIARGVLASGHAAFDVDAATRAIRDAVNTPGVTSTVVGTTSVEHLRAAHAVLRDCIGGLS